ncbi:MULTISPECIES: transcriptional regulator [unclassified Cupriavidus]|uniref:transcriptional regulator n=1 Tax=unclassified Cupriavidus TaxID=2640874 RepID=UPI00313D5C97
MTPEELKRAVEVAGGQTAVAKKIGCTSQAVSKWCNTGEVPLKRLIAFEKATGVRRQDLYPDLFKTTSRRKVAVSDESVVA